MRITLLACLFALGNAGCVVTTTNSCLDGIRDGLETDIDCGGGLCPACGPGRTCLAARDCTTAVCGPGGVCGTGSSCTDFILNGTETDVDCGGGACPACGVGRVCRVPADCASGACVSGRCAVTAFSAAPAADLYRIVGGQGVTVQPGTLAGYGITAAAGGSSFRLVWTGDGTVSGTYREFYGSVSTDGSFVSITPGCGGVCPVGTNDYVSQPYAVTNGTAVDFDGFNVNGLEGFDFVVTGGATGIGEPVYFDLYVDGQHVPQSCYFFDRTTSMQASPQAIPFGLTTQ